MNINKSFPPRKIDLPEVEAAVEGGPPVATQTTSLESYLNPKPCVAALPNPAVLDCPVTDWVMPPTREERFDGMNFLTTSKPGGVFTSSGGLNSSISWSRASSSFDK